MSEENTPIRPVSEQETESEVVEVKRAVIEPENPVEHYRRKKGIK